MIQILKVNSKEEGQEKAHEILKQQINKHTLLALSGGTSVDYKKMIVDPSDVRPGAIFLTDERYGNPYHKNSNELLLRNFGLIDFLKSKKIPLSTYLEGKNIKQTEEDYDGQIRNLFYKFNDIVGVMGIGANLHTAGIFPKSESLHSNKMVVGEMVDDEFPQRLTITLKALGEFTSFIIMMFGNEKKEAIKLLLDVNQNDIQNYPAVFYRKCRASVSLISDITI